MNNFLHRNLFIALIWGALYSFSLPAQDLIVTSEGDSLNCKITRIKGGHLYFTFVHQDEIRSTLIPATEVKAYQYNYFQKPEIAAGRAGVSEVFPRWRIAINGGWGYRIAKLGDNIPSDLRQYFKGLKSGFHYGTEVHYFFSEQLGAGFRYQSFRSRNSIDNIYVTRPDGTTQYGSMSDNIRINWIGPLFSTRLLSADKKNSFMLDLGLGYMGYRNNSVLVNDHLTFKGGTAGLHWGIGYDIGIAKNLALGFQLSYSAGTLTQYTLSDGWRSEKVKLEKEEYESLSRIDLSVGLRFVK